MITRAGVGSVGAGLSLSLSVAALPARFARCLSNDGYSDWGARVCDVACEAL